MPSPFDPPCIVAVVDGHLRQDVVGGPSSRGGARGGGQTTRVGPDHPPGPPPPIGASRGVTLPPGAAAATGCGWRGGEQPVLTGQCSVSGGGC